MVTICFGSHFFTSKSTSSGHATTAQSGHRGIPRPVQAIMADAQRLSAEETVGVAEDYMLLDNEALKIGEPRSKYRGKKRS